MTTALVHFQSFRPSSTHALVPGGYWVTDDDDDTAPVWQPDVEKLWLVPAGAPRSSPPVPYHPLESDSALFRRFAAAGSSHGSLVELADAYGVLWEPHELQSPRAAGGPMVGQDVDVISRSLKDLAGTVEMWDALVTGDTAYLGGRWGTEGNFPWTADPRIPWQLRRTIAGSLPSKPPASDAELLHHGWRWLGAAINQRLDGHVAEGLRMDERGELVLHIMPDWLLTAVWHQFAVAVAGRKQYRACRQCGAWFELDPSVARADKQYHSDACRAKAYRDRRAQEA